MGKFKEFLLLEMPVDTGPNPINYAISDNMKKDVAMGYMKTHKKIGVMEIQGIDVSIYSGGGGNDYYEYNLINEGIPETIGEYTFTKHEGFIEEFSIWQNRDYKGFFREWFKRYIIPKYKWIISDENHSKEGFTFWTKVITEMRDHIEFGVVDFKTDKFFELTSTSQMYNYWKKDKSFRDFRFYIKLK